MTRLTRLTILAVLVLGAGSLVLGSFGAQSPAAREHSPYLSALSDLSVKPAEAVPCNGMMCVFHNNPGPHNDEWVCVDPNPDLPDPIHCLLSGGGDTCSDIVPCP